MERFTRLTEEIAAIGQEVVAVGGFARPIGEERAAIETELALVGGFTRLIEERTTIG